MSKQRRSTILSRRVSVRNSVRTLIRNSALAVEAMECRQMLSVSLNSGVLTITGTGGADTYVIDMPSSNITVQENGGATQSFDPATVNSILANLGDGADSLTISANVTENAVLNGEGANDTLISAGGADTVSGGAGNDSIDAMAGNDNIDGGDGNDSILAGGGNDTIAAGTGDDTVDPGAGNDTIDGGNQVDTLTYASHSTPVSGQLNVNIALVGPPGNQVPVISSNGTINGLGETDTFTDFRFLVGGSGQDTLRVEGQDNSGFSEQLWEDYTGTRPTYGVSGGFGNDTMSAGAPLAGISSALFTVPMFGEGNEGNDILTARLQASATLRGGDGDDSFATGDDDAQPATIDAGAGIDSLDLESRSPVINSESFVMSAELENLSCVSDGDLTITGNALANVIDIAGDNVTINAGDGDDTISATADALLTVRAEAGNDTVRVNEDADINTVGSSRNDVDGGDGGDLIVINGGTDTVHGGSGNDSIYAGVGDDRVFGDAGNDRLNGDGGKDTLYGGDGDDRMYGNSGADRVFGDLGIDRLYGGNKGDYLDGGAGGDYVKGDEDTDTAKKDRKDRRYQTVEIFV